MSYRYVLTKRPPNLGCQPRGCIKVKSFIEKQEYKGIEGWGYVDYSKELTEQQINDYELKRVE